MSSTRIKRPEDVVLLVCMAAYFVLFGLWWWISHGFDPFDLGWLGMLYVPAAALSTVIFLRFVYPRFRFSGAALGFFTVSIVCQIVGMWLFAGWVSGRI